MDQDKQPSTRVHREAAASPPGRSRSAPPSPRNCEDHGHRARTRRSSRPAAWVLRRRPGGRSSTPTASSTRTSRSRTSTRSCEEHLLKGRIVNRLMSHAPGTDRTVAEMKDVEFFNRQVKIVLRNSGLIDPLKIEEYIAREGYQALAKVLTEMNPEEVVSEMHAQRPARPRRRRLPHRPQVEVRPPRPSRDVKYILCNADEGDPGAFMDRSVLEGDPHAVHRGHGHRRLRHRRQARATSTCGPSTRWRSSGCSTPSTRPATSACWARTSWAPTSSSTSRSAWAPAPSSAAKRPPSCAPSRASAASPAPSSVPGRQKGLWDKPSVLNNVETFANIAPIILKGAEWYAQHRHREEQGHQGLRPRRRDQQRRPGGSPHRACSWARSSTRSAAACPSGKEFKAVQLGGPSGGCIPKAAPQRARRLRDPAGTGRHHGLRRLHRHGRRQLHGRHGPLLPGLHPGRELRQVPALPGGHQAHARDRHPHLQR